MTIPTPPVGARVRHTTTYTDSTTVHAEGTVTETQRDNGFFIGDRDSALWCGLADKPGVYTVTVEVLEPPAGPVLPPEPPNGTVYVNGTLVWVRDDHLLDPVDHWWGSCREDGEPWEVVAPIVAQTGWRRHVPDPADAAPALPWEVEDKDGDRLDIQVGADGYGFAAMVSVNNESVYLAPAVAREAAGVLLRAVREFEERQR